MGFGFCFVLMQSLASLLGNAHRESNIDQRGVLTNSSRPPHETQSSFLSEGSPSTADMTRAWVLQVSIKCIHTKYTGDNSKPIVQLD